MSGGDDIRQFWNRYYVGAEGVIFVIDGLCTHEELEKTRKELFNALENPHLHSIPWLILCNKQDVDGASTHQKVRIFKCISVILIFCSRNSMFMYDKYTKQFLSDVLSVCIRFFF